MDILKRVLWFLLKFVFVPIIVILLLLSIYGIISNPEALTFEELEWCNEFRPKLDHKTCSDEFGY